MDQIGSRFIRLAIARPAACCFKVSVSELRCKSYRRSKSRFSFALHTWPDKPSSESSQLCWLTDPRIKSAFWTSSPISLWHVPFDVCLQSHIGRYGPINMNDYISPILPIQRQTTICLRAIFTMISSLEILVLNVKMWKFENILPEKVLLHWEKPEIVLVIFQISPATQPESWNSVH